VTTGIGVTEYLSDSHSLIQIHPSRNEIASKVASIFLGKIDMVERAKRSMKDFPTLFHIEESMADLIAIALKTKRRDEIMHQESLISHFTDLAINVNKIPTKQTLKFLESRKRTIILKIIRVVKLRVSKRLKELYYASR
jgi:hypothetical protein